MSDEITGQGPERIGVSRRTVMKGAAWSVPVVVVATAAPAIAQSKPIEPSYSPGTFCKHPGNPKYYHAVFCFNNTSANPITITVDNLDINGAIRDAKFSVSSAFSDDYTIPALTNVCLYVDAGLYDNSANGAAILSFHYTYNAQVISDTVSGGTVADANLNPCGTGSTPPISLQPSGDPPHATSGP